MADPVTIRAYRPGDEEGLLAGYNAVFPKARSMAHWRWKFLDNPVGEMHIAVAEHETQGIVGTYTCMPVRVQMDGEQLVAAQGLDMWVLPDFRRHGSRPGLFVHIGWKMYEIFGGTGKGQARFHYGWPIPNWRIGQKYLRYENIRDWDFLFRPRPEAGFAPRPVAKGLQVRAVERFAQDVDGLWDQLKNATALAIVRDARYLNWRYADAPDVDYTLFECRDQGGVLRGVAVYSKSDFLFPGTATIVDWLCPVDDDAAMTALVAACEQRCNEVGATVLATLFPQMDPRFLKFQALGFQVYGTSYFLVVIPFDSHGTLYYREQWYHTAGDSDLL
ncbi:MAG: GNAT family N-acetyltransferase [Planctomycetota bacterium]